jgi:hypothetical protein
VKEWRPELHPRGHGGKFARHSGPKSPKIGGQRRTLAAHQVRVGDIVNGHEVKHVEKRPDGTHVLHVGEDRLRIHLARDYELDATRGGRLPTPPGQRKAPKPKPKPGKTAGGKAELDAARQAVADAKTKIGDPAHFGRRVSDPRPPGEDEARLQGALDELDSLDAQIRKGQWAKIAKRPRKHRWEDGPSFDRMDAENRKRYLDSLKTGRQAEKDYALAQNQRSREAYQSALEFARAANRTGQTDLNRDVQDNDPEMPGADTLAKLEAIRAAGRAIDTAADVRARQMSGLPPGWTDQATVQRIVRARAERYKVTRDHGLAQAGFKEAWDRKPANSAEAKIRREDLARFQAEKDRTELAKEKLSDEVNRLNAERDQWKQAQQQARLEVLGQIRPMGGNPNMRAPKGPTFDAVRDASQVFPADWHAATDIRQVVTAKMTIGRAHFDSQNSELLISSKPNAGFPEYREVAAHEMGHMMEDVVPGMRQAEWAFWADRNSEGPNGNRTWTSPSQRLNQLYAGTSYADHEVVRRDDFMHAYTGKYYGTPGPGSSYWEVASMGAEIIAVNHGQYDSRDADYRQFILGLWATL